VQPTAAGDILVLNWRGDGFPKEANKIRPCVVVEDQDLFSDAHQTILVIPLTTRAPMVILQLSVRIPPTPSNGLERESYAPAYMLTAASKQRIDGEPIGRVTTAQLDSLRAFIAESIGIL
jgi:mRNA-degrading endonuclease toxin of MazEF toxin-antitoxin module